MKVYLIVLISFIACSRPVVAQYYYKDILLSKQAVERWKGYKDNKVKSLKLISLEANNQPIDGFTCEQTINRGFTEIVTHTRSSQTSDAYLFSYYDANGLLTRTMDTSDRFRSSTVYDFDSKGRIVSITNTALASNTQVSDVEQHQWQYNEKGIATGMLKIKNNSDTTTIRFMTDEKGNIVEEHASRNKINLPDIFYYYDEHNRLTDIVRYSRKAQRLLPDYVFEYDDKDRLISMLTVPEDSNGYQKWIYEYDDNGLRRKENCYNRKKELLGKVEYQYAFSK